MKRFILNLFILSILYLISVLFYASKNHSKLFSVWNKYNSNNDAPPSKPNIGPSAVFAHYDEMMERRSRLDPNLYVSSQTLPLWLIRYFSWHAAQRLKPPSESKYLLLTCEKERNCGGLTRRLGSLPFFIQLANSTNRVLLIDWEAPYPLTKFLVPPPGGMDWRAPDLSFAANDTVKLGKCFKLGPKCVADKVFKNEDAAVLVHTPRLLLQAAVAYFERKAPREKNFDDREMDGEIFRILFAPSQPLKDRVNRSMVKLKLVPDQYTSAHVRVQYPSRFMLQNKRNKFLTRIVDGKLIYIPNDYIGFANHALRCAALLMVGAPVYVSSDNVGLVRNMVKFSLYSKNIGPNITVDMPSEFRFVQNMYPVHVTSKQHQVTKRNLDLNAKTDGRIESDFYSIFEDLLVMASGRCVSYGIGDYGKFAARLTGNLRSCSFEHQFSPEGTPTGYCRIDGIWNQYDLDDDE